MIENVFKKILVLKHLGNLEYILSIITYIKKPKKPPNTLSIISSTSNTRPIISCVHSIEIDAKNIRNMLIHIFLEEIYLLIKNPYGINITTFPTIFLTKSLPPIS